MYDPFYDLRSICTDSLNFLKPEDAQKCAKTLFARVRGLSDLYCTRGKVRTLRLVLFSFFNLVNTENSGGRRVRWEVMNPLVPRSRDQKQLQRKPNKNSV